MLSGSLRRRWSGLRERSQSRREPAHAACGDTLRQRRDADAEDGMPRLRRDLRERDEREGPAGEAGVRNLERRHAHDALVVQEQVEVDETRPPALLARPVASELALDALQRGEQRLGLERRLERAGGVDERRLVRLPPRLGLVERGRRDERPEPRQPRGRATEISLAVADVAPETE